MNPHSSIENPRAQCKLKTIETFQPLQFVTLVVTVLLAVTVHEVCHGLAAFRLGDDTASLAGRLTLNPLAHMELFGSVLLPLMLYIVSNGSFTFAWAKPVPVNPVRFRRDISMRSGMSIVAAAGPLANILLGGLFAFVFRTSVSLQNPYAGTAALIAMQAVAVNLYLAIFNFIPIPPLDGSKVLLPFLSPSASHALLRMEPYGFFIIFGLLYLTPLGAVIGQVTREFLKILLG